MEYGIMPKLDVYSTNKVFEVQKIEASNQASELKNQRTKENEFVKDEIIKTEKTVENSKINGFDTSNMIEYSLTNFNFGFNNSSKDFFVRAVRENSENQFPTDEMMRLKAFLLKTQSAES